MNPPGRMTKAQRAEYLDKLREHLKPGDTVFTVIRHVAASGMSRCLDVLTLRPGERGRIDKSWLSFWVAAALDIPFSERHDSLNVSGAGMDMGFHVVSTLSRALFPDGFECIG